MGREERKWRRLKGIFSNTGRGCRDREDNE